MGMVDYLNYHFDFECRVRSFKQGKQYSCEIELTNRCNFSCAYCYASANTGKVDFGKFHLVNVMDGLNKYGIKEVGWIGGEPLLYPNFSELVEYVAADTDIRQALYTNAVLLDSEKLKEIKPFIHRYIVHVDSIKYDVWAKSQLKPNKKLFETMIKNIEDLAACIPDPRRIIVSIPLTRDCYNNLNETLQWASSLGISYVNLIPLTPLGRSNDKSKFITKEEVYMAMVTRASYFGPHLMHLGVGEYCKQFQLTDFTINYEGEVYPYIDYFESAGNVLRTPIDKILEDKADFLRLSKWVSEDSYMNKAVGCKGCIDSLYCFGNPVSRKNPSISKMDPDCIMAREVNG